LQAPLNSQRTRPDLGERAQRKSRRSPEGSGGGKTSASKKGPSASGLVAPEATDSASAEWERAERLADSLVAEGKTRGTARRFANELKAFFEDDGKTLWITFREGLLYWGLAEPSPPERHADGRGVFRPIAGSWRCTDIAGEDLTKSTLSGGLTKLTGYRGTSCSVDSDKCVIRRINGEKMPEVENALNTVRRLQDEVLTLIRMLIDYDFETLVDLIFAASGWQRQGPVGRTQKTVDLDLASSDDEATRVRASEVEDHVGRAGGLHRPNEGRLLQLHVLRLPLRRSCGRGAGRPRADYRP